MFGIRRNRTTQRLVRAGALLLSLAMVFSTLSIRLTGAAPQGTAPLAAKELIFISDGMRPDLVEKYVKAGDMPNYAKIVNNGVTGENGMVPQVAANTGAGWNTITTGAWPGTHGAMNNTFHINSNGILTTTSGFAATILQAETYGEAAEKAGKKVAIMEWPGTLPGTKVKGPAVDFRNFYNNRGVVTNYPIPNVRSDPGVVYTNTLQFADATGWTGAPESFSPAKEAQLSYNTNSISNTVATLNWPLYVYDSTNDNQVNYDRLLITREAKDAAQKVADLKAGEWAPVKVKLPQNGLLVGQYIKLLDLSPDLSKFRLYYTSLARSRSNMADLEEKIAKDFPPSTGADFAPLQAGYIDADTYIEQGLKWYDTYRQVHDYVIKTYNPDVVMAGYPDADEFSHQFLALATPSYTGPRLINADVATAEGYIKYAYTQADEILGSLWGLLGGSDNIVTLVGSDHGFAAIWKSVNANQVLQDAGLYDPANRAASKAVAYIAGGTANVYVNLKDREVGGVVAAADYETVRTQIIDAFNKLTDGGAKVTGAVLKKEEARTIPSSGGPINYWHPTRTGDVVVILTPPYQFDAPTTGQVIADAPFYGQHGFLPDTVDLAKNINLHAMFGIYGPGVAQGKKLTSPRAIDFIPTAAYAMGILPPRYAEGRVLTEAFTGGADKLIPIKVLAWGDYHGQLDPVQARPDNLVIPSGGVANIGAYWNEAKAKYPDGTIILSDGDNVGATPPNSAFLNDEPTIHAMNTLGFTASALGNHEFDKGVAGLQKLQAIADFPYLADNIVEVNTGKIAPFTKPYIIVKANGIDVGIIGIANPETPTVTSPQGIRGYNWLNPIAPTNMYVKELVGKGIKTIIVVYHQGSQSGDFDTVNGLFGDLVNNLDPEVDLVVGGHTRVKTMARVNGMLVSAANHALETSEMMLLVDPQTKNVTYSWGAFRRPYGGAITPDPALAALVKDANDKIKPVLGEQVGTAASLVDRSRGQESKMGNLVSDAIRATYQVDVALQNSGGLRADFNPGPVTKGDVFAVLPFGNLVVTGKLKGSDLLAALENGVSDVSGSAGRFIQLSGVRFAYDPAAAVGKRVLWAVLSDGKAVDPNATYAVATNDFMQVGGDGYTSLTRMTEVISREQLWEVAANYVKSLGTVDPKIEGRIVAAQAGQPAPTPPAETTPVLPTPASILPTAAPIAPTATAGVEEPTEVPPQAPGGGVPGMPSTGAADSIPWIIAALFVAMALCVVGLFALRRRSVR
ncbi:MAG TPA: 5'-nucleotidase C-terminal domain-containing protein [Chloroflexia bacterium]|nr:5'-nucleotidase C-terminal domain-containing protein [Chloroflexia bacterium]